MYTHIKLKLYLSCHSSKFQFEILRCTNSVYKTFAAKWFEN